MADNQTLRGLAQVNIYASDVAAVTEWYSRVFGIEPYFVRPEDGPPQYVEFRVGDYQHEFGIVSSQFQPQAAASNTGGAVIRWHVDDINAAVERLKGLGATEYEPVMERGGGFITGSVVDPFGNVLGLIYSPHYLETFGG